MYNVVHLVTLGEELQPPCMNYVILNSQKGHLAGLTTRTRSGLLCCAA